MTSIDPYQPANLYIQIRFYISNWVAIYLCQWLYADSDQTVSVHADLSLPWQR